MNHHEEAIAAIKARKYKQAAEYMISEFLGDRVISFKPKQILRLQQHVSHELQQQRNRMVQWKYSGRMEINNRAELAQEVYERTLPALKSSQDMKDIIDT
jgi:hypothetical protein